MDSSPDSTLPPSSEAVTPRAASLSIQKATGESSLWRTILDDHGEAILEHASDEFLDLGMSRRLKTIKAEDLVSMLARADRLGYSEVDIFDDDGTVHTILEARRIVRARLDTTGTSLSSMERRDRSGSDCTDSLRPPAIGGDRAAKSLKIHGYGPSPGQGPYRTQNVNAFHEELAPVGVQRSSSDDLSSESVPVSPQTREHEGAYTRRVEWVVISDSEQVDVSGED